MKSDFNNTLERHHYLGNDVVQTAKNILGKGLHTMINDVHTAGKIVEVEAYCGSTDRACHAYPNKQTERTRTMYMTGGVAYVYLVYGMHHLFNIVTNKEGSANAVLVRAIEPIVGLEEMQNRRQVKINNKRLTGGPARLTQALGITIADDRTDLLGDRIWLTDAEPIEDSKIVIAKRIGVDYAGEDAHLPWRFHIKGNKYVSK